MNRSEHALSALLRILDPSEEQSARIEQAVMSRLNAPDEPPVSVALTAQWLALFRTRPLANTFLVTAAAATLLVFSLPVLITATVLKQLV